MRLFKVKFVEFTNIILFMSLTKEQKRELNRLSEYFRKLEKMTVENNIDLDVYMTEYREDGYSVYATERISLNETAGKRRDVFEKSTKEKSKTISKNH